MASATTAAKAPRRTQEERRASTRAALLDATIACLVDYGYAGVTTTKVVERAGVSRGAQVHHFPTKAELVAEAVRYLAERRAEEMLARLDTLPAGAKRLDAVLDLLWEAHSGELFKVALELWVAARTDKELRKHLVTVERGVAAQIEEGGKALFGDVASSRGFRATLETALATMRGLALFAFVVEDDDRVARRWAEARKRLKRMFEETATV